MIKILEDKILEKKCALGLTFEMIISILRLDFSSLISVPIIWIKKITSMKNGKMTVGNTVPIIKVILSSISCSCSFKMIRSIVAGAEIEANTSGLISLSLIA